MDIYWAEFESTFDSLIRGVSLNTKLMSSGWSKSPTVAMKKCVHLEARKLRGTLSGSSESEIKPTATALITKELLKKKFWVIHMRVTQDDIKAGLWSVRNSTEMVPQVPIYMVRHEDARHKWIHMFSANVKVGLFTFQVREESREALQAGGPEQISNPEGSESDKPQPETVSCFFVLGKQCATLEEAIDSIQQEQGDVIEHLLKNGSKLYNMHYSMEEERVRTVENKHHPVFYDLNIVTRMAYHRGKDPSWVLHATWPLTPASRNGTTTEGDKVILYSGTLRENLFQHAMIQDLGQFLRQCHSLDCIKCSVVADGECNKEFKTLVRHRSLEEEIADLEDELMQKRRRLAESQQLAEK
ncbi:unnamed protein product [Symbiodinium natans]|uniref:Uncharacterized protein n=1 Tax=Symbiodinium natans TaxID=878477 RepID=A0A812UG58_9DINO|nr:unnamed protein product [Symbiodinium natans]